MATKNRHHDRAEAYRLGTEGDNAPEWVVGDSALLDAYQQGASDGPSATPKKATAPTKAAPAKKAASTPGPSSSSGSGTTPAPSSSGTGSGLKTINSIGTKGLRMSGAGDGGGLLLALVVYPIVLSVIKYGAAGPGMWFKAKFLNKTVAQPNQLPANPNTGNGSGTAAGGSAPATPTSPSAPSGLTNNTPDVAVVRNTPLAAITSPTTATTPNTATVTG